MSIGYCGNAVSIALQPLRAICGTSNWENECPQPLISHRNSQNQPHIGVKIMKYKTRLPVGYSSKVSKLYSGTIQSKKYSHFINLFFVRLDFLKNQLARIPVKLHAKDVFLDSYHSNPTFAPISINE